MNKLDKTQQYKEDLEAKKEAERQYRKEHGISEKSRLVNSLLAWLVGFLGVDRFYAGRPLLGILKLLTGGGFTIWWIIDLILALTGTMKDGDGRQIKDWQLN